MLVKYITHYTGKMYYISQPVNYNLPPLQNIILNTD